MVIICSVLMQHTMCKAKEAHEASIKVCLEFHKPQNFS